MKFFSKLNIKSFSLILGTFIILAISLGVFLFYTNPKVKFMKLVNNEYKSFVSMLDKAANSELATLSENNTINVNGNMSFNLSLDSTMFGDSYSDIVNIINGLKINYEYSSDKDGTNTYLKLDSNISNKDFLDLEEYQVGAKSYTYYNGIYDKYIESESIEYINKNGNQVEDLEYITNKIKMSFFSHIKSSDFKVEDKKITINNETIDTTKITFTLTDKRIKEIYKAILIDIRDDEKCIDILKKLNDDKDVIASINKSIDSIDENKLLTDALIIDMYVKHNSVRELDISDGKNKTIQYLNYENMGFSTKQIIVLDNKSTALDAKFVQKSPNDIKFTLSLSDGATILDTDIVNMTNSSTENKTWSNDISITTALDVIGSKIGTLTISVKTNATVGGSVKTFSSNNVIKESDLTEEEKNEMSFKLLQKIADALPNGLTGNLSVDTNDVY